MAKEKTGGASPRSVTRHATTSAPLPRNAPILLGTFGSKAARAALVKMPGGAVARLGIGDTLGGDRIVAIADDHIALAGAGRLHIPGTGRSTVAVSPAAPRFGDR